MVSDVVILYFSPNPLSHFREHGNNGIYTESLGLNKLTSWKEKKVLFFFFQPLVQDIGIFRFRETEVALFKDFL